MKKKITRNAQIEISPELRTKIEVEARSMWNRVGNDMLMAGDGAPVPQDCVIDAVYNGLLTYSNHEVKKAFEAMSVEQSFKILTAVFPRKSYS